MMVDFKEKLLARYNSTGTHMSSQTVKANGILAQVQTSQNPKKGNGE